MTGVARRFSAYRERMSTTPLLILPVQGILKDIWTAIKIARVASISALKRRSFPPPDLTR